VPPLVLLVAPLQLLQQQQQQQQTPQQPPQQQWLLRCLLLRWWLAHPEAHVPHLQAAAGQVVLLHPCHLLPLLPLLRRAGW
jgi:hypothetical protein